MTSSKRAQSPSLLRDSNCDCYTWAARQTMLTTSCAAPLHRSSRDWQRSWSTSAVAEVALEPPGLHPDVAIASLMPCSRRS